MGLKSIARPDTQIAEMPTGGRFILFGDSLSAAGAQMTGAGGSTRYNTVLHQVSPFSWFQAKLNYPFTHEFKFLGDVDIPEGDNKGISGDETADVLSRLDKVLSVAPATYGLIIGTNDLNAGRETDTIVKNVKTIIEEVLQTGSSVWLFTLYPRHDGAGSEFTAEEETQRLAINAKYKEFEQIFPGRVLVVDSDEALMDESTGALYTSYSSDGVHLNSTGASNFADYLVDAVWNKISNGRVIPRNIPQDYDSSDAPFGNIVTNGTDFDGTAGTTSTGTSGTVKSNFQSERAAGSTVTAVASINNREDISGNTKSFQSLAIDCAGAGIDGETIRLRNSGASAITNGVDIGDWFVLEVEIHVDDITSGDNILRAAFMETRDGGTDGDVVRAFGNKYTQSGGTIDYFPEGEHKIVLRTPPLQCITATGVYCRIQFDVNATLTGNRSVHISQPVIKPIPNPNLYEKTITRRAKVSGADDANYFILPSAGAILRDIIVENTTSNAITGGLKFGTTSGGTDIVSALTVGADADVHVTDAALLKKFFGMSSPQPIFFDAVTSWNSAEVNIYFVWDQIA